MRPFLPPLLHLADRIMKTLEALIVARDLHARLFHGPIRADEKPKLARQIEGQLFVVEANSNLPVQWRTLLSKLKNDAHHRSTVNGNEDDADRISDHYEKLAEALQAIPKS